jgi:hypothetical protein
MMITYAIRAVLAGLVLAAVIPGTALADRHWHGRDIHRFPDHDLGRWQGGYWHHGHHLGRHGWWWVVGGAWYFYSDPVYPYPDPYTPPVVVVSPPVVSAPPLPAPAEPVVAPAPAQYWYYCDASKTYYPYVATCPAGWRRVPATPTQ